MFKARKLKKISICLAISVVSSIVIWNNSCLTVNADMIPFKDSNLKKRICGDDDSMLNRVNFDIFWTESLRDEYIWSLEGIQNLRNLEFIGLYNTNVWDLSPISNLSKVGNIRLSGGCITDLTPLGNMKNLQSLYCDNLKLDEYSAIGNLENLESLRLEYCNIKDISFLKKLKNLKYLRLNNNYIENIEVLRELKKLKTIELNNNEIKDISPLLDLPSEEEYAWDSDYHTRVIEVRNNYRDFSVNWNKDKENKNMKVIEELEKKGFEVSYASSKKEIHPIKINGEKSKSEYRVKPDRDVYIEFNCDIENKLKNFVLTLSNDDGRYDVEYKLQGNFLIFNPSKAFKCSDSASIDFCNKHFSVSIPDIYKDNDLHGDVNKDGKTDITDLSIVAKDYNKNSRDATTWNINEDCNKDGRIDIYDISIINSEIQ